MNKFSENISLAIVSLATVLALFIGVDLGTSINSSLFKTFYIAAGVLYFSQLLVLYLKYTNSRTLNTNLSSLFDAYPLINLVILPVAINISYILLYLTEVSLHENLIYFVVLFATIFTILVTFKTSVKEDSINSLITHEVFDFLKLLLTFLVILLTTKTIAQNNFVDLMYILPLISSIFLITIIISSKIYLSFWKILIISILITILFMMSFILWAEYLKLFKVIYLNSIFHTFLFYILISIFQQIKEKSLSSIDFIKYIGVIGLMGAVLFYFGN